MRDPVTIPMVKCFVSLKNHEQNISGKRVAVFGLHNYKHEKVVEYVKTGKSDYFIVPIIGDTSAFVL